MIAISDSAKTKNDAADDVLKVRQAAPIAGMSELAFFRAVRLNLIPAGVYWKIGRNIRVSRSRLTDWLNAGGSSAAA